MDDYKKEIEDQINKNEAKLVAHNIFNKLTFEQVELLSRMLNKDINYFLNIKNSNDYNFDLVSKTIDKAAMLFMESGQKVINNGDVLYFLSLNEGLYKLNTSVLSYDNDKKSGNYDQYPYNLQISSELRIKNLLKTESKEEFNDLYEIVKLNLKKFCSETEISKLDKAVESSRKRIFKNKIKFLNPIEGTEQGKTEDISVEDFEKYNLEFMTDETNSDEEALKMVNNQFKFDLRNDNFDIIALKCLSLVLNGDEFDYFNIASGFFNKIMPELNEQGIHSVILKVSDKNILENIKFVSFQDEVLVNNLQYSPLTASLSLLNAYSCSWETKKLKMLDGTVIDHVKLLEINLNELISGSRFYITVNGAVASPTMENMELGYKKPSFNTEIIPAGETFLYENRNNQHMLTRMFFTPYSYDKVHIVHHHGSVIWGQNDQTFQSCSQAGLEVSGWEETLWMKMIQDNSLAMEGNELFSPAMIAASYHLLKDNKNLVWQFFIKQEYWSSRYLVTRSILETCNFTNSIEVARLNWIKSQFNQINIKSTLEDILEGYAPLHKRFHLQTYLNENRLSYLQQETFYNKASNNKTKTEVLDVLSKISEFKKEEE